MPTIGIRSSYLCDVDKRGIWLPHILQAKKYITIMSQMIVREKEMLGISPKDSRKVEFSTNDGRTWNTRFLDELKPRAYHLHGEKQLVRYCKAYHLLFNFLAFYLRYCGIKGKSRLESVLNHPHISK